MFTPHVPHVHLKHLTDNKHENFLSKPTFPFPRNLLFGQVFSRRRLIIPLDIEQTTSWHFELGPSHFSFLTDRRRPKFT